MPKFLITLLLFFGINFTKPYWVPPGPIGGVGTPEYEYLKKGRVCGVVAPGPSTFHYTSLHSGGAKLLIDGESTTLRDAELKVEGACK